MKKMSFLRYKRYIVLFVSMTLIIASMFLNSINISATNTDTQAEVFEGYNASESIVQVVLLYQDTNSVYHILQSGSGILVDEKTVVTNNHLTYMSDEVKEEAGAYLTEVLGYEVSFIKTEDYNQNVATYSIAIVQEADIYNIATVALASNDWDFAILSLSSQSDKQPAVLGKSEYVTLEQEISTVGLPSINYSNAVSFTDKDVITTTGKCVNLDGGVISFDARLEAGSSGGALVDKYGRVVGITTYKDNEEGIYCALPIDNVKGYLERSEVVYTEDDKSIEEIENTTTEETTEEAKTDKNELNRVIMEAELIYEEGNDGEYTEDSFRNFRLNLDYAKITYEDPAAPQTTIDSDTINLRNAIDNLEKVEKKSNVPLMVIICVASVLVLTLVILLIVLLVRGSKKRKEEKKESEKIKTLPQGWKSDEHSHAESSINENSPSFKPYGEYGNRNYPVIQGVPSNELPMVTSDPNPGTTILTNYVKPLVRGYIYCTSTGETIQVEGEEFVIGKAPELSNYVVQNNSTISRKHAKIIRKYDEFFIEDLGSTNFTYLNSVRVVPGDKKILQDRDVIYLSDEEFIFMLGS